MWSVAVRVLLDSVAMNFLGLERQCAGSGMQTSISNPRAATTGLFGLEVSPVQGADFETGRLAESQSEGSCTGVYLLIAFPIEI